MATNKRLSGRYLRDIHGVGVPNAYSVGASASTGHERGSPKTGKPMGAIVRKLLPHRAQALTLTGQERRVLDLLCAEGMSNAELGHELAIAPNTVKRHIAHLMEKTGYSTRLELVVRTLQERSAPPMTGDALTHELIGLPMLLAPPEALESHHCKPA